MQTNRKASAPSSASPIAVLLIALGGVGGRATNVFRSLHTADDRLFPAVVHHIDTDPSASASPDVATYINLDSAGLDAMRGSPRKFGPHVKGILERLDPILRGDPSPGARTTRACSQLFYAYHRDRVISDIGYSLSLLTEQYHVQNIVPFIVSSSGGGTGSALTVLLLRDFQDPDFRHRICLGHQAEIHQPVVLLNEPYAHIRNVGLTQARKIQGNMYALRLESDHIQNSLGVAHAFYHLGLSNSHGVVLADADSMATVLGHGAYYIAQQWEAIRSASCDNAETNMTSYGGQDTLERQRPELFSAGHRNSKRADASSENGQEKGADQ